VNGTLRGLVDLTAISSSTAILCLDRLNTGYHDAAATSTICADDNAENEVLSPDRLIDIAYERGLEAKLRRLDWRELQIAASVDPVLLLLRNGNVVIALRSGRRSPDEIVVYDPLYRDGEDFLLPRDALEPEWDGDAVTLKRLFVTAKRPLASFVSALSFCVITASVGLLLFYPRGAGKELAEFAPAQHLTSSELMPAENVTGPAIMLATPAEKTGVPAQAARVDPEPDLRKSSPSPGFDDAVAFSTDAPRPSATKPPPDAATTPLPRDLDKRSVPTEAGPKDLENKLEPMAELPLNTQPEPNVAARPLSADLERRAVLSRDSSNVTPEPEPQPEVAAAPEPPDPNAAVRPPRTATDAEPAVRPTGATGGSAIPTETTSGSASRADTGGLHTGTPTGSSKDLGLSGGATVATASGNAPSLSSAAIKALMARGDALFSARDFVSARLFYERAADAGGGQAALRLGETYDPAFLMRARLTGVRGDASLAARWYRRARELGVEDAELLLKGLTPEGSSAPP
jgi:hypothetical protein